MRLGASPRANCARCVEGWKTCARSSVSRSLMGIWRFIEKVPSGRPVGSADVFELGEFVDAMPPALAPQAGLLDAAEGDRGAGHLHAIDGHHAVGEPIGKPADAVVIAGV